MKIDDQILSEIRYATISSVDSDGQPWAAPVWYVFDKDRLFWWSPLESQHSKNIELNPDVFITIFNSTTPEGEGLGLYFKARANVVDGDELDTAIQLYNASTSVFKLNRENCTNEAPTRMYKALISQAWKNDGIERKGFYIDKRVEL